MRLALTFGLAAAGAAACTGSSRRQPVPHTSDSQPTSLETTLARALADGVGPDALEARVGRPAIVNTVRPGDRSVLQSADIRPDPSFQPSLPPLADASEVVYWKVDETAQDVILVGVYWLPGQPGVVFRGLLGPP